MAGRALPRRTGVVLARGGSCTQNRFVVALDIVAITLGLLAFVGPWWVDSAIQTAPIATWEFGPIGVTYTVPAYPSPPKGTYLNVTGQQNYSVYPQMGSVFFVGAVLVAAGVTSGVGTTAYALVSTANRRVRRLGTALGVLATLLMLAGTLEITLFLPGAANHDGFSGSLQSFWGSAPATSRQWGDYMEVWGAGWAWYVVLVAAVLFLIAGLILFRARMQSAGEATPPTAQQP